MHDWYTAHCVSLLLVSSILPVNHRPCPAMPHLRSAIPILVFPHVRSSYPGRKEIWLFIGNTCACLAYKRYYARLPNTQSGIENTTLLMDVKRLSRFNFWFPMLSDFCKRDW
ncbi:hypothetical protein V8C34DRAFT_55040 [Trichoderma compactum]